MHCILGIINNSAFKFISISLHHLFLLLPVSFSDTLENDTEFLYILNENILNLCTEKTCVELKYV